MTLPRPTALRSLLVAGAAFLLALGAFTALRRPGDLTPSARRAAPDAPLPGLSTLARIARLQAIARARPHDPRAATALGLAYLQRVRETGDASYYTRAGAVIAHARRLAPHDPVALTAAATLALARHDFRAGLALAVAARRAAPALTAPYPAIVDGNVELGRYAAADHALQHLIDTKPTLAGYARVSYLRELHGDLAGAISAMRLAITAGGDEPESVAYVQTLLGALLFTRGEIGPAAHAYRLALSRLPGYVPAEAGLAKVDAARGRLPQAIRRLRPAVARLPLPEYTVQLGEAELAAGRRAAGRRDLALVGAEERLLRVRGVNADVDLALYEASHGSPRRGLVLARRAWAAAPSVRSADAVDWALTRSGRPRAALAWAARALRLGSKDPLVLLHAGLAARAAGRPGLARRRLRAALAPNPRFSPYWAPRARAALAEP
jgi:tetratricopeptide (TPR) repeat protein